ncbi:MBL fold metallo-hydrolase [Ramlibacter sp. PS4R-6]|uniref:MBL fold metallo-hydrolase n=1 Tax=Ramlibacter sp. PS4R-6 TaxID=3133438 RepID=UPI0030B6C4C0
MLRHAALAAALLLSIPFLSPDSARAEAPLVKKQAPGFYRAMVGDIEVTALLDGTAKLPMGQFLSGAPKEQVAAALGRHFLEDTHEVSVTAYLVNTGGKLVLIDTGSGGYFGDAPLLVDNLRAAGYRPEQVDEVCITHMHGDHIGGLMTGTARTFPNARLRIDKADTDYWLSDEMMAKAGEQAPAFKVAMEKVRPYAAAGRLATFEGVTQIAPGVTAVPTHGHTPGHAIYRIESKGQTLVLWGDLMHVASVQFEAPRIAISFDTDSPRAIAEREKAFAEAAQKRWMVGAAHISFPGLGRIRAEGNGYAFEPLNYSILKN